MFRFSFLLFLRFMIQFYRTFFLPTFLTNRFFFLQNTQIHARLQFLFIMHKNLLNIDALVSVNRSSDIFSYNIFLVTTWNRLGQKWQFPNRDWSKLKIRNSDWPEIQGFNAMVFAGIFKAEITRIFFLKNPEHLIFLRLYNY